MEDCARRNSESGKIESPASNLQLPISIVGPAPNSIYQISPQIPLAFQQIEVSARLNAKIALREVRLVIDGQTIATFSRSPYRALWQLTVGEHEVKAIGVDEAGKTMESELVKFRVIGEQ